MLKRVGSMLVAVAALAACSESTVPTGTTAPSIAVPEQGVLTRLTCRANVAAGEIDCDPASPTLGSGLSPDIIFGGQLTYVRLISTITTNTATTLTANVTVRNLTAQPWGTSDGTTPTGNGVRVFFYTPPTNGVTVTNASGSATFLGSTQQYFQYSGTTELGADGILTPGETSTAKPWMFDVTASPGSFTFQVLIWTNMPAEQGVLRWTRTIPTGTARNAVWGTSATDVWTGGVTGSSALDHYDGTSWTPTAGAESADITGIWGSTSSNVYAVGGTFIQRYDGVSWTDVSSGATNALNAVWGSSATDVYAGGLAGTLVRSTGGAFTPVLSTGLGSDDVYAIWGSASNNVYVGGTTVRRWDGASWLAVSAGITNARAIWGTSATDVWIGGQSGALVHWNGTAWSTITGFGATDITGIWGTSTTDVTLVNRGGQIWHYNGSSWLVINASVSTLRGVWGSGPGNIFAVGTDAAGSTANHVMRGTR